MCVSLSESKHTPTHTHPHARAFLCALGAGDVAAHQVQSSVLKERLATYFEQEEVPLQPYPSGIATNLMEYTELRRRLRSFILTHTDRVLLLTCLCIIQTHKQTDRQTHTQTDTHRHTQTTHTHTQTTHEQNKAKHLQVSLSPSWSTETA